MPASTPVPAAVLRLAGPLGATLGVGAAFAFVGAVDPHRPGRYPVCPVLRLTGLHCPGCGGLRSAHAIAHGDLAAAVGANALAVAAFAVLALVLAAWFVAAVRRRALALPFGRVNGRALLALTAGFTLLRNLPVGAPLAP